MSGSCENTTCAVNNVGMFYLNGQRKNLIDVDPELTVIEYLRDLGLTGTKLGCGEGGCGACTVVFSIYDPIKKQIVHRPINSCLTTVYSLNGGSLVTIEKLSKIQRNTLTLHPIQQVLSDAHGSQCGFCTPGFIMSIYAVWSTYGPENLTLDHLQHALDGNLCRCTGYRPIVDSLKILSLLKTKTDLSLHDLEDLQALNCSSCPSQTICQNSTNSCHRNTSSGEHCPSKQDRRPLDDNVPQCNGNTKSVAYEQSCSTMPPSIHSSRPSVAAVPSPQQSVFAASLCGVDETKEFNSSPTISEEKAPQADDTFDSPAKVINTNKNSKSRFAAGEDEENSRLAKGETMSAQNGKKGSHLKVQYDDKEILSENIIQWSKELSENTKKTLSLLQAELPTSLLCKGTHMGETVEWYAPRTLRELCEKVSILNREKKNYRIAVGNSERRIEKFFKRNHRYPLTLISPAATVELRVARMTEDYVEFGCSVPIADIVAYMEKYIHEGKEKSDGFKYDIFKSYVAQFRWFAGTQVRNVATLGGNIITASPISDMNSLHFACQAKLHVARMGENGALEERDCLTGKNFFVGYRKVSLLPDEVAVSLKVPLLNKNQFFFAYKQGRRREDDIAVVNAGMWIELDSVKQCKDEEGQEKECVVVRDIHVVYGGVSIYPVEIEEMRSHFLGKVLNKKLFIDSFCLVDQYISLNNDSPGGMPHYRKSLCKAFLLKFYFQVLNGVHERQLSYRDLLPALTSQELSILNHPTTYNYSPPKFSTLHYLHHYGLQQYKMPTHSKEKYTQSLEVPSTSLAMKLQSGPGGKMHSPVGEALKHLSGDLHVSGVAKYVGDTERSVNECFVSLITSKVARGKIVGINTDVIESMEGFLGVYFHQDIPGSKRIGAILSDEDVFAVTDVYCIGQVIGIVAATSHALSRELASLVDIKYDQDGFTPIISIEDAILQDSFFDLAPSLPGRTHMQFQCNIPLSMREELSANSTADTQGKSVDILACSNSQAVDWTDLFETMNLFEEIRFLMKDKAVLKMRALEQKSLHTEKGMAIRRKYIVCHEFLSQTKDEIMERIKKRNCSKCDELLHNIIGVADQHEESLSAQCWIHNYLSDDDILNVRVLNNNSFMGGQEHFYLETNASVINPTIDGEYLIESSTQNPSKTQKLVSEVLNLPRNRIVSKVKRLGGGFGGKETRACFFTAYASIASFHLKRKTWLLLDRDVDMCTSGQRHSFYNVYQCLVNERNKKLVAVDSFLFNNGGWSTDLSVAVCERAMFHMDNVYFCPLRRVSGYVCKSNILSNTAFRGFGGPQGQWFAETLVDQVAMSLGTERLNILSCNMYQKGDTTPFHMSILEGHLSYMTNKLITEGRYEEQKKKVELYNDSNTYTKQGLSFVPVKFGMSFTKTFMNQGGALVHLYQDGSVYVSHGGVEMGQGINVKMLQIVCDAFQIPSDKVNIAETSTDKVSNTLPTAASVGADINGMAVYIACKKIIKRIRPNIIRAYNKEAKAAALPEFTDMVESKKEEDESPIPSHPPTAEGNNPKEDSEILEEVLSLPDMSLLSDEQKTKILAAAATEAHFDRINLSGQGFYATPSITWIWSQAEKEKQNPFFYFAYGVAVSTVQIDLLTGDHLILETDIIHDTGHSLNQAVDIGQIEGAFVQGLGLLSLEEFVYNKNGTVMTFGPGNYKIPTVDDIPRQFNIHLLNISNVKNTIKSSKGVGEPPLFLAASVIMAIKNACYDSRVAFMMRLKKECGCDKTKEKINWLDHLSKQYFRMDPPFTMEKIGNAVWVWDRHFTPEFKVWLENGREDDLNQINSFLPFESVCTWHPLA